MTRDEFDARRRKALDRRWQSNAPLSLLTTFRVGGAAEWLADIRSITELQATLADAAAAGVPVTLVGGGSNLLVADSGLSGVVIRLRLSAISQPAPDLVRAEAGATINGLVRWTVGRGFAGIEEWAGTPGTVGGAIYGNAHWNRRNLGDLVRAAMVMSRSGLMSEVPQREMAFAYDTSRLQHTGEILISADFVVSPGESGVLRERARASLHYRKTTQPLAAPSAGCIFQNPDPERDGVPDGIPPSAGALIDRAGLKGRRVGGAYISETHANFIVNDGSATAADVRALAELARAEVRARFGVLLRDEIVCLGTF